MNSRIVLRAVFSLAIFSVTSGALAIGDCVNAPALPAVGDSQNVIRVNSETALQQAMGSLGSNTVLLLEPGVYRLSNTLWVSGDNVTIRGNSNRCDDIVLEGQGMENAAGANAVPHGIWTNATNLKVQNLTIRNVYKHAIVVNGGGQSPQIYNVRMADTGEQFVKVNPLSFGKGVDNGKVEYSVMEYTSSPPSTDHGGGTGYTNGVDVHAGKGWIIRNNRFENFHTPDNAQNLWNPAILMWNGAADTLVENNQFIDVDRAIAFGLLDRAGEHDGGIIRNNMIVMRPNLYSSNRTAGSDATILVWSSPSTQVLHNTIVTQGNTNMAIELRFNSAGAVIRNNLIDASISDRSGNSFEQANNVQFQSANIFKNTATGDLHLTGVVTGITDSVPVLTDARVDIDGQSRGDGNQNADAGADERVSTGSVCR